jgi:hypothetical protein
MGPEQTLAAKQIASAAASSSEPGCRKIGCIRRRIIPEIDLAIVLIFVSRRSLVSKGLGWGSVFV